MSYFAYQPVCRSDSFSLQPKSDCAVGHPVVVGEPGVLRQPLDRVPLPEVELAHDQDRAILWQFMRPQGRPSFTPGLLRDMTAALDVVEAAFAEASSAASAGVDFLVLASRMAGIFNLGGDLPHFIQLIQRGDRERLSWYARVCAKGQYRRASGLDLPICTIALVQGDALGGGFEAALAHDVIIAERSANFGLPEVLFNLFPGMGAYSFLARRLDTIRAEKMILSGRIFSAAELFELGVVDHLADDGDGINVVHDYVREFGRAPDARRALLKARRIVRPVTLRELIEIADLWVEAALRLQESDLRRMRHLAKAQDRRWNKVSSAR